MLVNILDGDGAPRTVVWQGQDQVVNRSGALAGPATGGAPVPQKIADATILRAGVLFQNTSQSTMLFFDNGNADPGWLVNPGGFFPPFPGYPIPIGDLYVQGLPNTSQLGDTFTCKEWINRPDDA